MECPACGYVRTADDEAPEWQCPGCQRAYNKIGASTESSSSPRSSDGERTASNNRQRRSSSALPLVIGLAIGLVIGYFAGREHLKYQIAGAFTDALSGFAETFTTATDGVDTDAATGGLSEGGSVSREPSSPRSTPQPEPSVAPMLPVQLLEKDFRSFDLDRSTNPNAHIYFELQMTNALGRDLRAFRGVLELHDIVGDVITRLRLKDNDPRAAGETWTWRGSTGYNQFDSDDKELRGASIRNVNASFTLNKVVYADGTSEEF